MQLGTLQSSSAVRCMLALLSKWVTDTCLLPQHVGQLLFALTCPPEMLSMSGRPKCSTWQCFGGGQSEHTQINITSPSRYHVSQQQEQSVC